MKIAVLLPGLIRTFDNKVVIDSFNKTFDSVDFDSYSSIWDIKGKVIKNKDYKKTIEYISDDKILESDIDFLKNTFNIKKIKIDSYKKWNDENFVFLNEFDKKHKHSAYQMTKNGIFSQYYQILESYKLIENPNEYDIIVKSRYDITFNKINFNDIKLKDNTYYSSDCEKDHPTDFLFLGTHKFIKEFMDIYDYMKNIEPFNPLDITNKHHIYVPENMTKKFLNDKGFEYQNLNLNKKVIR